MAEQQLKDCATVLEVRQSRQILNIVQGSCRQNYLMGIKGAGVRDDYCMAGLRNQFCSRAVSWDKCGDMLLGTVF